MPELAERVATLEANWVALDRRAETHEKNDDERFKRSIEYATTAKQEILEAIKENSARTEILIKDNSSRTDALDLKIDTLRTESSERKGAIGASKYIAGIIGGGVGAIAVAAVEYFKRG